MKERSQGLKRDLFVAKFAYVILETAKDKNVVGREVIPNCKERNQIMRRCEKIKEECREIYAKNMQKMTRKYFEKEMKNRIFPALKLAEETNPQLETFAIYVLYINFLDNREKKVDEMFDLILKQKEGLFETLDLIEKAFGREVSEMYDLAIEAIKIIKR